MRNLRLSVVALSFVIVVFISNCAPVLNMPPVATDTPKLGMSYEEAIRKATDTVRGGYVALIGLYPGGQIDSATAELMTMAEYNKRSGAFQPGDPSDPVWYVTVRGYWQFTMRRPPSNSSEITPVHYQATSLVFWYNARTGEAMSDGWGDAYPITVLPPPPVHTPYP